MSGVPLYSLEAHTLRREVDRQRDMSPAVENSRAQIAFYYGNTVRRMVVGKDGYPFTPVLTRKRTPQELCRRPMPACSYERGTPVWQQRAPHGRRCGRVCTHLTL